MCDLFWSGPMKVPYDTLTDSCYFQPFLGIGEASNRIVGKIKMGSDTLAHLEGHWDQEIYIKDKTTGVCIFLCRSHTGNEVKI